MILFSLIVSLKAYWLDALILLSPVAMIWSGGTWDWTTVGWYWRLKRGGIGSWHLLLVHYASCWDLTSIEGSDIDVNILCLSVAFEVNTGLECPAASLCSLSAFVMDIPRPCIPTNTHMFRIAVENPPWPSQTHPAVSQQFLEPFGLWGAPWFFLLRTQRPDLTWRFLNKCNFYWCASNKGTPLQETGALKSPSNPLDRSWVTDVTPPIHL